jgi:hypothetical protein
MSYLEGDSLLRDIAKSFADQECEDLLMEGGISGETEENDEDGFGEGSIGVGDEKGLSSKEPSAAKKSSSSQVLINPSYFIVAFEFVRASVFIADLRDSVVAGAEAKEEGAVAHSNESVLLSVPEAVLSLFFEQQPVQSEDY